MNTKIYKLSLIANVLLLLLVVFMIHHYDVINRAQIMYEKTFHPEKLREVIYNKKMRQSIIYNDYLTEEKHIVMLGDSMFNFVSWRELLGRNDVINRSISGFYTAEILKMMPLMYRNKPEYCFIICGANGMVELSAAENFIGIQRILANLKERNIIPIIHHVLYVTEDYPQAKLYNERTKKLNTLIGDYCKQHNILVINMNTLLAPSGILEKKYTQDGMHLLPNGYVLWRDYLLEFMKKNSI